LVLDGSKKAALKAIIESVAECVLELISGEYILIDLSYVNVNRIQEIFSRIFFRQQNFKFKCIFGKSTVSTLKEI
jgi:hypothetical protein